MGSQGGSQEEAPGVSLCQPRASDLVAHAVPPHRTSGGTGEEKAVRFILFQHLLKIGHEARDDVMEL